MNFRILPEYEKVPGNEKNFLHCLIQIETPPYVESGRQALNLAMALDTSKSMQGEKLEATVDAASALINWLTRNDKLAIISYDSQVEVIQPLIALHDKVSIVKALQSLKAGSSTNLSGGWLQALRSLEEETAADGFRRVILLTDGMANTGVVGTEELLQIARDHQAKGITTTTIGFGRDFSENLLREIAREGGGNFYFIEGPEQAQDVFFREFGDVAALMAQGVDIRLKLPTGVRLLEVLTDIPYEEEKSASEVHLHPGDLRSDDLRNLVVVLEVDSNQFTGGELLNAEMTFYNVLASVKMEKYTASAELEIGSSFSTANPSVKLETLMAATARSIVEAARIANEREVRPATEILESMKSRLLKERHLNPEGIDEMVRRLDEMLRNLQSSKLAGKRLMSQHTPSIRYSKDLKDDIIEISMDGQLDLYRCPELKNRVSRHIDDGVRFLVFDMTELNYIDSSGIGTLIQIMNWLKKRGGLMILANVQGSVEKVFQISRMEDLFTIRDSLADARMIINDLLAARDNRE